MMDGPSPPSRSAYRKVDECRYSTGRIYDAQQSSTVSGSEAGACCCVLGVVMVSCQAPGGVGVAACPRKMLLPPQPCEYALKRDTSGSALGRSFYSGREKISDMHSPSEERRYTHRGENLAANLSISDQQCHTNGSEGVRGPFPSPRCWLMRCN
jgi:hypothetical protein